MSEHRIALRRAWDLLAEESRRIDLPAEPSDVVGLGAFGLLRKFHVPRLDPERESLSLRLDDLPGLVSVRLDGELLAANPEVDRGLTIQLGRRLAPGARATLELAVDLRGLDPGTPWDRPFGSVSLVIESREP